VISVLKYVVKFGTGKKTQIAIPVNISIIKVEKMGFQDNLLMFHPLKIIMLIKFKDLI
jgi:hypothetical protein